MVDGDSTSTTTMGSVMNVRVPETGPQRTTMSGRAFINTTDFVRRLHSHAADGGPAWTLVCCAFEGRCNVRHDLFVRFRQIRHHENDALDQLE